MVRATVSARAVGNLSSVLYAPLLLLRRLSRQGTLIDADLARWIANNQLSHLSYPAAFLRVCREWPEFRSVLYFRTADDARWIRLFAWILRAVYRPMALLYIDTKRIGPGFFVNHGFGSVILAEEIGENCQIFHGVTIGYTSKGPPKIGSRVEIGAGAKVLGKITVGDDVFIGANAVVLDDVPSGMIAVGVPAQVKPHGRQPLPSYPEAPT